MFHCLCVFYEYEYECVTVCVMFVMYAYIILYVCVVLFLQGFVVCGWGFVFREGVFVFCGGLFNLLLLCNCFPLTMLLFFRQSVPTEKHVWMLTVTMLFFQTECTQRSMSGFRLVRARCAQWASQIMHRYTPILYMCVCVSVYTCVCVCMCVCVSCVCYIII